jgi:hypothetical protein
MHGLCNLCRPSEAYVFAKFGGSPWWNGDPFARTPRRFTTGRPSSAYRLLSDQLRDYGVDVPYIQAHIHGLSSRLVLYLDDSLTVLRDEEVDGPVSVVVSFPCVLHYSRPGIALAGGLTRRIERRRTSVRRPAKRVDRNGALDRHDWLSACRSA